MGSIVVCGGSVIGLSTAMMLARDGHQVTVLEADPGDVPPAAGDAWGSWQLAIPGPDREQLLQLLGGGR